MFAWSGGPAASPEPVTVIRRMLEAPSCAAANPDSPRSTNIKKAALRLINFLMKLLRYRLDRTPPALARKLKRGAIRFARV
jgi:hypothetical protein